VTEEQRLFQKTLHQLSLELEKPSEGGRPEYMYVNVPRVTSAGHSVDLIDIYRKYGIYQLAIRLYTENNCLY
jgi:hypothetical protein